MTTLLTDEVWTQLDPHAGRLSRRVATRLWTGGAVAVIVLLAGVLAWWAGLVVPRLAWPGGDGGYAYSAPPGGPVAHEVTIVNAGRIPVHVVGIGRDGPGLKLQAVSTAFDTVVPARFPLAIEPGQTLTVTLVYQITDCSAVGRQPWPVPVRVERPWGEQTAYVSLPVKTSRDAPTERFWTGEDPFAVQWQRHLTDLACHPG